MIINLFYGISQQLCKLNQLNPVVIKLRCDLIDLICEFI